MGNLGLEPATNKLDISLAARQMGHSVQVHTNIYQRWIDEDVHQKVFDRRKEVASLPFQGESAKNCSELQAPSFQGGANPKSKI
jgi:hypothetical protein